MKGKDLAKKIVVFFSAATLMVVLFAVSSGADEAARSKWVLTREFKDKDFIGTMNFSVTYFSSEYIQASMLTEAEKNLWTTDELENYKYQYLKTLNLDEYIPFLVEIDNNGPAMHMSPFGDQFTLWVGKKQVKPVDYDKRFNFALTGKREGFLYFPRFDEKTGKSILEGVDTIRLVVHSGISALSSKGSNFDFIWNISNDNPEALTSGSAAERLEADRLIKRLQKLNAQKAELEEQMQKNADEISMIEARLAELQGK
jgi:hypothetical protein